MKKEKPIKKQRLTFSKKLIAVIVAVALIDLQLPFVLAFLGKSQIAETLAVAIVTEIIGVVVTYSVKAFFETREEENNKIKKEYMVNKSEEAEG